LLQGQRIGGRQCRQCWVWQDSDSDASRRFICADVLQMCVGVLQTTHPPTRPQPHLLAKRGLVGKERWVWVVVSLGWLDVQAGRWLPPVVLAHHRQLSVRMSNTIVGAPPLFASTPPLVSFGKFQREHTRVSRPMHQQRMKGCTTHSAWVLRGRWAQLLPSSSHQKTPSEKSSGHTEKERNKGCTRTASTTQLLVCCRDFRYSMETARVWALISEESIFDKKGRISPRLAMAQVCADRHATERHHGQLQVFTERTHHYPRKKLESRVVLTLHTSEPIVCPQQPVHETLRL
jgi:hypothetical protein